MTTENTPGSAGSADLARVEEKLDLLLSQVGYLAARQRRIEELVDEAMPIGAQALTVGAQKLQGLEDKGYMALGSAMLKGLDNVVEGYQPEDFEALARNMVAILDVVRTLTQPDVLAIADEAAEVLHNAGKVKPVSMLGAVRASRDEDVQKGIGVALEVMRHVGRVSRAAKGGARRRARTGVSAGMDPRLADRLAPSRRAVRVDADQPAPRSVPHPSAPGASAGASKAPAAASTAAEDLARTIDGVALDDKGFLADPTSWTRDIGTAIATAEGIAMTDDHWKIVDWCRATYAETGASPNIRALTRGMGIETKAVYGLFPQAPGRTIARIAGVPKPAGCL